MGHDGRPVEASTWADGQGAGQRLPHYTTFFFREVVKYELSTGKQVRVAFLAGATQSLTLTYGVK